MGDEPAGRLVITAEDLRREIVPPPRRFDAPRTRPRSSPSEPPGVDRLAVASLVAAVLGIPLFGVVTGLVAILLASLALGRIREGQRRGAGLAVCGLLLGVADMVGWTVLLVHLLSGQAGVSFPEGAGPAMSPADVTPKLYRAMRANVVIDRRGGWGSLATGSGVILDITEGAALIVTNRHIVDPGSLSRPTPPDLRDLNTGRLSVTLLDGPARPARVTWVAPDGIDLALVRVACSPGEAEAARWQPARPLRIGDPVFAIGNPKRLSWTHTQGVISQFRTMTLKGRSIRVIQTQTAINAGNSGGGLYDDDSYLIGINTWTSDKSSSEGLSFAITFESLLALDPPGLAARGAGDARKGKAQEQEKEQGKGVEAR